MNIHHSKHKKIKPFESLKYFFQDEVMTPHPQGGFTIVEALVAITILLLVIIGPMTAAQKGAQSAYFASEQITAVFLAQEAIEAVRVERDKKALDVFDESNATNPPTNPSHTADWATTLVKDCKKKDGCTYEPGTGFAECKVSGRKLGCPVYFDSTTETYTQSTGNPTHFYRNVRIEDLNNGSWRVTSKVAWKNEQVFGSAPQEVVLETWIYDQYKLYE